MYNMTNIGRKMKEYLVDRYLNNPFAVQLIKICNFQNLMPASKLNHQKNL